MVDAQYGLAASHARSDEVRDDDERLPLLQAAAVIAVLSLGLWSLIGVGLDWIVR